MEVTLWTSLIGGVVFAILCYAALRVRHSTIHDIPGPRPESFLKGNVTQMLQADVGELEFQWREKFGDAFRLRGTFGQNRLWVADPKAINHVLQTSVYNYHKIHEMRALSKIINGCGLLSTEGSDHVRHRRALAPGFAAPQAKACFHIFQHWASELANSWLDLLGTTHPVIDVTPWLNRATMDAIGEAAFDYQFGAMKDAHNPLFLAFTNMVTSIFHSKSMMMIIGFGHLFPERLLDILLRHLPFHGLRRLNDTKRTTEALAKSLIASRREDLAKGGMHRDVVGLLVEANASSDEQMKLSEAEMLSQIHTIILTGHETVATSLSFCLLELAERPEMQARLRAEIRDTCTTRGKAGSSPDALDSMPYLSAFMKEVLRFHPVASHIHRDAAEDDVLPLSHPVLTTSGQRLPELKIRKGQRITISIAAYNRRKDIFGEDADVFRPERWLDGTVDLRANYSVGVIGGLLTFSLGPRVCIGWRFAILELQAFLVELIDKFQYEHAVEPARIRRLGTAGFLTGPALRGEEHVGCQLPLRISLAPAE